MLGIRRTSFHMCETSKYFNVWDEMHQVAYPVHLRKQVGGMKDPNFIVFFLFFVRFCEDLLEITQKRKLQAKSKLHLIVKNLSSWIRKSILIHNINMIRFCKLRENNLWMISKFAEPNFFTSCKKRGRYVLQKSYIPVTVTENKI